MNKRVNNSFKSGLIKGIPIALGYFPVSFTFGVMATSGGLSPWLAVVISMTNLTSAGQFAGTKLIIAGASYIEIALTTFVINIRYMLMSLALSQKIKKTPLWERLVFSFGITDETFAIASVEPGKIGSRYMYGLIGTPYIGWALGTLTGAFAAGIMPKVLHEAMGIALYGMFLAIIIPPAKKNMAIGLAIVIASAIMCMFTYVPIFSFISSGFQIILATIITAAVVAWLFPSPANKCQQ